MEVPATAPTVGWFKESPTPGERGPAILAAHVDRNYQKGAFYDLHKLEPGDEVVVDRADGSVAVFEVSQIEQYPKDNFPTQKVYGDVDRAELRLITCGGEVNRQAHSYRDNVVVYAGLVRSSRGRARMIEGRKIGNIAARFARGAVRARPGMPPMGRRASRRAVGRAAGA